MKERLGVGVGQRVGYVRVSSILQNTARQLDGVDVDRTFTDKASARTIERPELEALRRYVRDGDTVVVDSMDRLARRLVDLRGLVDEFTDKGVTVEFVKEGLTFTGDDSPMQTLMLSMMGAVAEFERSFMAERQAEGIQLAKQKGKYTGRKPSLTPDQAAELCRRAAEGERKTDLAKEFGIGTTALYSYLKKGTPTR